MFDQIDLHYLLQQRGQALKNENEEERKKIEKEIYDHLQKNNDKMWVPKEAYIIFENEESFHRAMKYNVVLRWGQLVGTKKWRGDKLFLCNIVEPSNISFENKFKSSMKSFSKFILINFVLLILILIIWMIIFIIQSKLAKLHSMYPQPYWDYLTGDLREKALVEFFNYENSDKSELSIQLLNTDNLQCFWDKIAAEKGYLNAIYEKYEINISSINIVGYPWHDYLLDFLLIKICDILMPVLITIFNFILMYISSFLLYYVRLQNKTVELAVILSVSFMMTFINTGVIILLVNGYSESIDLGSLIFKGEYPDFDFYWYNNISKFFLTPMFLDLISPIYSFLIVLGIQKSLAFIDRRFSDPKLYKTYWKTAYDYAELNSGTEIKLSDKYSRMLKILYVSTMYGFGMPLLPLIMLLWLIVSYVFEKYVVAFYHRKPPMYDKTLGHVCIYFGKWSAFLYIAFGYWLITNKTIFDNKFNTIEYQAQIVDSSHYIFEIPDKPQQIVVLVVALLILLYLVVDFIILIFYGIFKTTLERSQFLFEWLLPFYDALDKNNLQLWLQEENFIRKKLGYKYLFDEFYEKLKQRNSAEKQIKVKMNEDSNDLILDSTNYDLLYIPYYANLYAYIPVYKRKNTTLDLESSYTRFMLDYPYHQRLSIESTENENKHGDIK